MSEVVKRGGGAMGTGVMIASLLVVTGVIVGGYVSFQYRARKAEAAVAPDAGATATTQPGARIGKGTPAISKLVDTKPDVELMKSALSVQQSLRVQLALYRLMHRDELPDLVARGWEQLLRRTRPDGAVADDGACGPYLQQRPVNPLNKLTFIAAVSGVPKDALPSAPGTSPGAGFLFEPATGRLWLTDAGGIRALDEDGAEKAMRAPRARRATAPRETELSAGGKRGSVESRLFVLRSQIELYRLQHDDVAPDLVRHPGWAQLYRKTRRDGTPDDRGDFGPYLVDKLPNPLNGSAAVMVVDRMPAAGAKARGGKVAGFFYERATGLVAATDEHGALVHDEFLRGELARRAR